MVQFDVSTLLFRWQGDSRWKLETTLRSGCRVSV